MFDILVLGGGASGFAAAISAAKSSKNCSVAIVEGGDRVLKKLALTGNGQCNLTNINKGLYFGDKELANKVISRFPVPDTLDFFKSIGVDCVIEESGKVYPRSKQASSVCDCLRFEAEKLGISVFLNERINKISKTGEIFEINTSGNDFFAKKVIYALGGAAYPKLLSSKSNVQFLDDLNIKTAPFIPALVQLTTTAPFLKSLKGIKADVNLSIFENNKLLAQKTDEIHFAGNAISGPVTFSLSPFATFALFNGSRVTAKVDFFPERSKKELFDDLVKRHKILSSLNAESIFSTMLHNSIGRTIVKLSKIPFDKKISELSSFEIQKLVDIAKELSFEISDSMGFNYSQSSIGGVVASELTNDLMSKKIDGLYFSGEAINVCGECGGYNLQFAWSSGIIAGLSASSSLK